MAEQPLILLTNDDGYNSPGLLAAAAALLDMGELLIVAPLIQQSGMGRSWPPNTTGIIHPVQVKVAGKPHPAYAIDGSPAQVVAHALLELAPRRPDLAVSGINFGENLGSAVTSSGTVGAALEAAISGIPSLAVSLETDKSFHNAISDQVNFSAAAHFTCLFARRLLAGPLPTDVDLIKIDVPSDATPATAWETTRQSRRRYFVALPPQRSEWSEPTRLDYTTTAAQSEPGTDVHTMACRRLVAVTPLSLDLTSRTNLESVRRSLSDEHDPATA